MRELTRTEDIIYQALLTAAAEEHYSGRYLTEAEFLTIVERAANEIKIPVSRPEELAKKIEEGL